MCNIKYLIMINHVNYEISVDRFLLEITNCTQYNHSQKEPVKFEFSLILKYIKYKKFLWFEYTKLTKFDSFVYYKDNILLTLSGERTIEFDNKTKTARFYFDTWDELDEFLIKFGLTSGNRFFSKNRDSEY